MCRIFVFFYSPLAVSMKINFGSMNCGLCQDLIERRWLGFECKRYTVKKVKWKKTRICRKYQRFPVYKDCWPANASSYYPQLTMKLLAVFAATVACVSAGTFVSPTNGSTISSSGVSSPIWTVSVKTLTVVHGVCQTFNFTWVSSRYFKESSRSVTVLLGENLEGVVLAKNLASTAQGEGAEGPTYHAQLTPQFVASSPPGGNYQVIVIEDYSSYGVSTN